MKPKEHNTTKDRNKIYRVFLVLPVVMKTQKTDLVNNGVGMTHFLFRQVL